MKKESYLGEEVILLEREYSCYPFKIKHQGTVVQESDTRVNVKIYGGRGFWGKDKWCSTWWLKDGVYHKIEAVRTDGVFVVKR